MSRTWRSAWTGSDLDHAVMLRRPVESIYIKGTDGDDELYGSDDDEGMNGRGGDDVLHGGLGNDTLNGSGGSDVLLGASGADNLYGGSGDDVLYGGTEREEHGGSGIDSFHGGPGRDRLYGGYGGDILTGEGGRDRFIYTQLNDTTTTQPDVIKDFQQGRDELAFRGAFRDGYDLHFIGTAQFSHTAGEVRFTTGSNASDVQIDLDGDGAADCRIRFDGLIVFEAGDFSF